MSGEGGPLAYSGYVEEIAKDETPGAELGGAAPIEPAQKGDDVLADIAASERGAIARRIGAIVAQCQREASEGMVPIERIELRLVLLADDVRGGLHGRGGE